MLFYAKYGIIDMNNVSGINVIDPTCPVVYLQANTFTLEEHETERFIAKWETFQTQQIANKQEFHEALLIIRDELRRGGG